MLESLRCRIVKESEKGLALEERLLVESRGRLRLVVVLVFAGLFSVYMKIVSWDTRGLGSKKKGRIVKSFLSSQDPDIVMI